MTFAISTPDIFCCAKIALLHASSKVCAVAYKRMLKILKKYLEKGNSAYQT